MNEKENIVRIWEEKKEIPTYEVGEAEKNPMFLEKRVYQGSSGKVYPHPVIDKIADEKKLKSYQIIILENKYIRIEMMPEIGGRVYRALDKTNDYDFVYYNRVIKPALVGLAGPWISGGIEFNWPQHHRPNTFGPVDYRLNENEDGSATVWLSEIDRMYGTKMTAGFTLKPNTAYLKIDVQLYNRTSTPQTFLWWANPAVAVNDHTQSVFPPDVNAVLDHGKRDVSTFPIATGTYYKMDYSAGVDISRYKNIPVPTSYMAYKSDYNFVGGYDHQAKGGLLHVANHHISPGKKQWTWGNGEFGQAWDRNLTDEDGPYIELMTGVYTDNQPDFTWLQPYEVKSFSQYFMPYKEIGVVKNATIDAAVNLKFDGNKATIMAYSTSLFENAIIEVTGKKKVYLQAETTLSPNDIYHHFLELEQDEKEHDILLVVKNSSGRILVSYQPSEANEEEIPKPADPLQEPSELKTNEQLYLAGLHLEQYRHATFEPESYYLEGLKRDPDDIRINIAYGLLILRRGLFSESEKYFKRAVKTLTWRNSNPYDSEAYYQLGLSLKLQGKLDEAFAAFYKCVWSGQWQDSGYFSLAQIATEKYSYNEALELVEKSLSRNINNMKARHLKITLLRKLGRLKEALSYCEETIKVDYLDFGAYNEKYHIFNDLGEKDNASKVLADLTTLMRSDDYSHLHLATDYAESGLNSEAIDVLKRVEGDSRNDHPMVHYTLAYLYKAENKEEVKQYITSGYEASTDYCFPNTLFELIVLDTVLEENPNDDKAHYYLGDLLYDKKRYRDAINHWESSKQLNPDFATVHRNLALGYFNKVNKREEAVQSLEQAFKCNKKDARVLYELDQLYKKLGESPDKRLSVLNEHLSLVQTRDDLYLEYITLLVTLGDYEYAIKKLTTRQFHPWEGGEGKVTGQYVIAHVELGKRFINENQFQRAVDEFTAALTYPSNLGEGKLHGAQENNIYYFLGYAYEGLNHGEKAEKCFKIASEGLEEPASAMYYNDQPPEMIFYQGLAWRKLGNEKEAKRRFDKLIDYADRHIFDNVKIDFFAVSLPDFLIFDEDLNKRNTIHCHFMRGLGLMGLNDEKKALVDFDKALKLDANHQGIILHKELCRDNLGRK
ncbi:DUF5107 domain-containing protein [Salipaludibacillus sp. HK11]|uniref:DUF5107 domain-containing protein n=1 Tax=Salipaludibacillus sp. HK11 TaxID=3394320 RepID=UPI0039FBA550